MDIKEYNEIMELLTKYDIDLDELCLIYNTFCDFDSRDVKYNPEAIIDIVKQIDISNDATLLVNEMFEDLFDEIEERL